MSLLLVTLVNFVQLYGLLIIIRILLSWFQTMDWAYQVISFLAPITDPYLNLFRSIIPPLGGLDLSPILAIIVLNLIPQLLVTLLGGFA
jgi:YggT family protein